MSNFVDVVSQNYLDIISNGISPNCRTATRSRRRDAPSTSRPAPVQTQHTRRKLIRVAEFNVRRGRQVGRPPDENKEPRIIIDGGRTR